MMDESIENLFNPAYMGELLRRIINSYQETSNELFPVELSYLTLPILLHKRSLELLPPTKKTFLNDWIYNNPTVKIGFPSRARSFNSLISKTLLFLYTLDEIVINSENKIELTRYKRTPIPKDKDELQFVYQKSEILGSMFAKVGDVKTIFYLFGVKP